VNRRFVSEPSVAIISVFPHISADAAELAWGTYRLGTLVCFGDLAQISTEKSRI